MGFSEEVLPLVECFFTYASSVHAWDSGRRCCPSWNVSCVAAQIVTFVAKERC